MKIKCVVSCVLLFYGENVIALILCNLFFLQKNFHSCVSLKMCVVSLIAREKKIMCENLSAAKVLYRKLADFTRNYQFWDVNNCRFTQRRKEEENGHFNFSRKTTAKPLIIRDRHIIWLESHNILMFDRSIKFFLLFPFVVSNDVIYGSKLIIAFQFTALGCV